jgi:hypothetical protein
MTTTERLNRPDEDVGSLETTSRVGETMTIGELRKLVSGGLVTNDRGNGCGGPGYLAEASMGPLDCDDDIVTVVSSDSDPEAYLLIGQALRAYAFGADDVELVAVGERSEAGYQLIVAG